MPVSFFLSSIVAGSALVILIDMWIAKGWRRAVDETALASVGQITFWSMLVYLAFRLGDMALRGQLAGAFSGSMGLAFAAEIVLGGFVPLALLSAGRSGPARHALLGGAAGGSRRRLQPHERRDLRDDVPGPDALGGSESLRAVDFRVGHLGRLDRRDDLPVRPRRAARPGPADAGGRRGTLSALTRDALAGQARVSRAGGAVCAREIDGAVGELEGPSAAFPVWDDYRGDYLAGVPLLQSDARRDRPRARRQNGRCRSSRGSPRSRRPARLAARRPGPGRGRAREDRCRAARRRLASRRRSVRRRRHRASCGTSDGRHRPGFWPLSWRGSDGWRDEERWLRRYCPTCGSPAGDGATGRRGSGAPAAARVRLLRHAVAVQAYAVSVL